MRGSLAYWGLRGEIRCANRLEKMAAGERKKLKAKKKKEEQEAGTVEYQRAFPGLGKREAAGKEIKKVGRGGKGGKFNFLEKKTAKKNIQLKSV